MPTSPTTYYPRVGAPSNGTLQTATVANVTRYSGLFNNASPGVTHVAQIGHGSTTPGNGTLFEIGDTGGTLQELASHAFVLTPGACSIPAASTVDGVVYLGFWTGSGGQLRIFGRIMRKRAGVYTNLFATNIVGAASNSAGQEGWRASNELITYVSGTHAYTLTTGAELVFNATDELYYEIGLGDWQDATNRSRATNWGTSTSITIPFAAAPATGRARRSVIMAYGGGVAAAIAGTLNVTLAPVTIAASATVASAGESLLETVTLDNFSGASRTDPYVSFKRSFAEGLVPSGSMVEMRYAGTAITLQQADERALHDDGSLRIATFNAKVPAGAVADAGTIDVALYTVTGDFDNTTSIVLATLTAQDYKMRIKIGGTDYWCKINNLGAGREIAAGPACRAWHHYGIFRAGEGASDTDQGQFQGTFYSCIWSDGTISVFPAFINGRIANGTASTVSECEFKNGATSIINHTTSFVMPAHSGAFLCTDDALPRWSANATDFWARITSEQMAAGILLDYIHSTADQRAAITIPAALSYNPHTTPAGDIGDIDQGGASEWIGMIPAWSARALICNSDTAISAADRKLLLRNDRVNALARAVKTGWFIDHVTGQPPNLLQNDYTAAGLGAAQPSIGWGTGATITDTGGTYAGRSDDGSHLPSYSTFQAMTAGGGWWTDMAVSLAVATLGNQGPGTASYARNPIINSNQYYGGHIVYVQRMSAWKNREWSNMAWCLPDAHPCKAYMNDGVTQSLDIVDEYMTFPHHAADRVALGVYPWAYGDIEDIGVSVFMNDYMLIAFSQMVRRGQATTARKLIGEYLQKQALGAIAACPYWYAGGNSCAFREGSDPTGADPIAQDWTNVYISNEAMGHLNITVKLISDAGGVSGACPASGGATPYTAGHSYPQLCHAALEAAHLAGLPGATTGLRDYMRAVETAAALTEAAWGAEQPQWRIRQP